MNNMPSNKIQEWVQVKEYEIYIHAVKEQEYIFTQQSKRIVYVEVEYRNQTQLENMSCRRNQWHLFSQDGYSFEHCPGSAIPFITNKELILAESVISTQGGMCEAGWLLKFLLTKD